MTKTPAPIPIASVVVLPRWMMLAGVAAGVLCIAAGIGLCAYGIAAATGGALGGYIGGGLGCIIGGGGGLFGVLCDWRRRIPAPMLFSYLKQSEPMPFYRRVFWPASVLLGVGVVCGLVWGGPIFWHGCAQTGGMLAFLSGSLELVRRHVHRLASAVFTLYAEGQLDPADAAAIDDARSKDPKFDAAIREHQRIVAEIGRLS